MKYIHIILLVILLVGFKSQAQVSISVREDIVIENKYDIDKELDLYVQVYPYLDTIPIYKGIVKAQDSVIVSIGLIKDIYNPRRHISFVNYKLISNVFNYKRANYESFAYKLGDLKKYELYRKL